MADKKRLIDADVLSELLDVEYRRKMEIVRKGEAHLDTLAEGIMEMSVIIGTLPAVDAVEVVHGRWVGIRYDGYADGCPVYDLWECSNCREEYESDGDAPPFTYCPNCGAKMDGERKDNGKINRKAL